MASFSHYNILIASVSCAILISCINLSNAEASIGPSITGGYNKLAIGSKFCSCVSIKENCTNPSLQLSRFKCQKDYQYCCNRGDTNEKHDRNSTLLSALQPSSPINSSFLASTQYKEEKENNDNSAVTNTLNNFNSRVKVIILTELLTTEKIPTQKIKQQQQETTEERNKMNCTCKTRKSCPEEFTDYGFGFFCAHDTVRCCEPVNDLLEDKRTPPAKEMNASAEESKTETENENNTKSTVNDENNCQCTLIEQCDLALEKQNEIEIKRRQDIICPDNLIHCCHLKSNNVSSNNERSDQVHLILDAKEETTENLNPNKVYANRGDNLDDLLIMTPASRVEMTTVATIIPLSPVLVKEEKESKNQGLLNIDQSSPVQIPFRPTGPSVQQYQQAVLMQQKLNKYYYNNNNNNNYNSMRGFSSPSFLSSLANFLG